MDNASVIEKIKNISSFFIDSDTLPLPYQGKEQTLAILLGTDPGNRSKKGETVKFKYVFGLENCNSPYFNSMRENMKCLSINLDNLYIQNLCRNYFSCDTYKHIEDWKKCAKLWLPILKEELNEKFSPDAPVLISAEILLDVLLRVRKDKASKYYTNKTIIHEGYNFLDRKLIPFYRNLNYQLSKWPEYARHIDIFINYVE